MKNRRPIAKNSPLGLVLALSLAACDGGDSTPTNLGADGGTNETPDAAPYETPDAGTDANTVDAYVGPTVALTLDATGGWGKGILHVAGYPDCTGVCTYDVPENASVTVTAEALYGQQLSGWVGECDAGTSVPSCTLVLDQPRTATAYFTGGVPLSSVKSGGGSGMYLSDAVGVAGGDLVLCGYGKSTVPTVDGGSAVAYGGADAFVARMHPDGSYAWVTRSKGSGGEGCDGITADANGNLYVTGSFNGGLELANLTLTSLGSDDPFVASLDSQGNVRWVVRPSTASSGAEYVGRPLSHSNGHIYVPGKAPNAAVVMDFAVADGSEVRVDIPGSSITSADALAEAPEGDLYVGGQIAGDLGVPKVVSATGGDWDMFVARVRTTGAIAWAHVFGNDGNMEPINAMTSDASGNLYVGGEWTGSETFPSRAASTTAIGGYDWFVLSYDAFGTPRWARLGGGTDYDAVVDLAVDPSGTNLYVTGYIRGTGTNPVTTQSAAAGTLGSFLVRIDATRQSGADWVRTFLSTGGTVQVNGLALQTRSVAVVGEFTGSSSLGMGASAPTLTGAGYEGFIHVSGL